MAQTPEQKARSVEARQRRDREATQFVASFEQIMEPVLPSLRTCIVQMSAALENSRGIDHGRLSQSLVHPMRLTKLSELMDMVEVARGMLMAEGRDDAPMNRHKAMLHRYAAARTCVETLLDLIDPMRKASGPWMELVKNAICFDDLDEDVKSRLMICYQQICFDLSWKGHEPDNTEDRTHKIARDHALAIERAFFRTWQSQKFLCWSLLAIFEMPMQNSHDQELKRIFGERILSLSKAAPESLRSIFGNDQDGRLSQVILSLTRQLPEGEKLAIICLTKLSDTKLDAFKDLCIYPFENIFSPNEPFQAHLDFMDGLFLMSQNPETRAILASERLKMLHRQLSALTLKQNTDFNFRKVGELNAEMEKIILSDLKNLDLNESILKEIFVRLNFSKPKEKEPIFNLLALKRDDEARLNFATLLSTYDKDFQGLSVCREVFRVMQPLSPAPGLPMHIAGRSLAAAFCLVLTFTGDSPISWIFFPMALVAFYTVPSKFVVFSKRESTLKVHTHFLGNLMDSSKRIAAAKESAFESVMTEFRKKDEEIEEIKSMISAYEGDGSMSSHVA